MSDEVLIEILSQMSGNLVALKDLQGGLLTTMDRHFTQLGEVLAQMETNRARQEDTLARLFERLDVRLARQDEMLARIDEHTTMIAQILARFDQGRNGHAGEAP